MSLLGGILGHSAEVNKEEMEQELAPVLVQNENVEMAFRVIRDLVIFTNKRLILIDKQGVTGNKKEYITIPYHSVSHFSVETAGRFDMDSELRVWLRGASVPIKKEFKKDSNIEAIQKTLATYILK